jgi:signal transduction histidine kinase
VAATESRPAGRRWLPRWTLRLRLTLLYGLVFLVAGAVLLAITFVLVSRSSSTRSVEVRGKNALVVRAGVSGASVAIPPFAPPGKAQGLFFSGQSSTPGAGVQLRQYNGKVGETLRRVTAADQAKLDKLAAKASVELDRQRSAQLNTLLTTSGIALGITAVLSIGLGWLMAGRALRPVRTMSARVRGISERNLHERLALVGPNDELKELGDTFDGLLGRLETAFDSQRRFVANASHELRTPITLERTLVEVALADPDASMASMRDTCRRVLAAGEQQERLIEALLTLARSQRGLERREELDLGDLAGDVIQGISADGVRLEAELGEAGTTGDPALVERLIGNLVDNAVHYNQAHGWVRAWTGMRDGRAVLRVSNTGPAVSPEETLVLAEPFRRLGGQGSANGNGGGGTLGSGNGSVQASGNGSGQGSGNRHSHGLGLGLSIVDAIATAHGADLRATPRDGGGLEVEVRFPGV